MASFVKGKLAWQATLTLTDKYITEYTRGSLTEPTVSQYVDSFGCFFALSVLGLLVRMLFFGLFPFEIRDD